MLDLQGILILLRLILLRNPIFVIFQGGGSGPPVHPPLDPHMLPSGDMNDKGLIVLSHIGRRTPGVNFLFLFSLESAQWKIET